MKPYIQSKSGASLVIGVMMLALFSMILLPMVTRADTSIPLCEITRGLKQGASGEDVRCLQRYLNWSGNTIAATGPGSPGSETAYFGAMTANAVMKWQNANATQVLSPAGLSSGTGYFGPLSFNWYASIVRSNLGVTQ
jgi:hypothetical protein